MGKIFNDANDKNVAVRVIYANDSKKLFYDAECKNEFNAAKDGLDYFLKGVVAVKGNVYYAAQSCTAAGVITFGFPA